MRGPPPRKQMMMVLTMSMVSSRSRRMFCNNRKRQYILKGLVNLSVLTICRMATANFRRAANSIIRQTVFQGHSLTPCSWTDYSTSPSATCSPSATARRYLTSSSSTYSLIRSGTPMYKESKLHY
ncbi:hypothetical protein C2845_PM13G09950 [Panicum miliaceum]|uniref:Uncharacterized protein n=1 Tax=Panicum miliaceum TaxID=4540 RepID=A0A3L6RJB9_PANMI|nr:hypothetical protein C2845_PM13G09950 [Panicum miliaceum]